ncbi:hypothetical protein AAHN97_06365 [Chitinophaga niabensis]|uniref:hypothetical protein n=1 Tax=Chitinophaga niabensis TaxID=536979 RepID=UPI0031BBBE54
MRKKKREEILINRIIAHCNNAGIDATKLSILTKLETRETRKLLARDITFVGFYLLKEIADVLGISYTDLL